MTANGWLQILVFFAVLVALMRPLGIYMARVFEGQKTFLDPILKPVERLLYRLCGVKADVEMGWREYGVAMLLFSFVSLLLTYLIERAQHFLPWNPQGLAGVEQALAWKNDLFLFHDTDLGTIMRMVSRWYDVKVVYEGKTAQTFNGKISRDTPLSKLLTILELTGDIYFTIEGDTITVKNLQ